MEKNKQMGLISATMIGISSIIGSGWLFAAYKTSNVAGPAALLSWIIAAGVVLLLGLCFAEVGALYPKRGITAVVATMSHNKYFGFPFAIANWLGVVAVISLEVVATIQYFINLFPDIKSQLYSNEQLTFLGILLSLALLLLYAFLNFWGVNLLAKTNNFLSLFKIFIPIIIGVAILTVSFHPQNFYQYQHSFLPYGFSSVITAIITTGIVVSFNGFQSVISFANEVKNPSRNIPLSIVISIIFSLLVYLLLQVAFVAGMPPSMVAHGWRELAFNAPMVELSAALGLGFLSTLIYFGAFVSPSGTGITYVGSATRLFTALSNTQQMPKYFGEINPKIGMSRRSLVLNILIAGLFLIVFKSWVRLSEILSVYQVFSYLSIPIALVVFRYKTDKSNYKFRVFGGSFIALFCFVIYNYFMTFVEGDIMLEVTLLFLLFQIILWITSIKNGDTFKEAFTDSFPIFFYLFIVTLFTYMSPNNLGILSLPIYTLFSFILSTAFFIYFVFLGRRATHINSDAINKYINENS